MAPFFCLHNLYLEVYLCILQVNNNLREED